MDLHGLRKLFPQAFFEPGQGPQDSRYKACIGSGRAVQWLDISRLIEIGNEKS